VFISKEVIFLPDKRNTSKTVYCTIEGGIMVKKAISLLLIISLLVVMSFQSYAFSNIDKSEAIKSEISFIDGEGKENTIILTILGHGRVHSEHFIEGKLLN